MARITESEAAAAMAEARRLSDLSHEKRARELTLTTRERVAGQHPWTPDAPTDGHRR